MPHQMIPRGNRILLPGSALFGLFLLLFGLFQAPPAEIFAGLRTIVLYEGVLITDYIAIAGIGPAFVNSGLVTLISLALLKLTHAPVNGSTLVAVGLMSGFSLFGKNFVNIWPIIIGTALYALLRKESFTLHVNMALRATSLAPMVSFIAIDLNPWLGILIGLVIGILVPPVAEHAHHVQNGMNLYSLGFACGLVAMMLVPAFKAFGLEPASVLYWSTGNNFYLGLVLTLLCLLFIAGGLSRTPRQVFKNYSLLLRTSGRAPSDYVRTFPLGTVLVNIGVNGLLSTYYIILTGGDLNGATIGAIFTIMGFSAHGKHAFNCLPVMAGVLLGSLLNHVDPNTPSLQMAGLFGTTLAPFAGVFGWHFGLLAGLIHSSVVLQAGLPLEGMNLYNNGFSGGLVAIVLYPVLISLVRHRRPVLAEEDLFALFQADTPQSIDQLPNRKDQVPVQTKGQPDSLDADSPSQNSSQP